MTEFLLIHQNPLRLGIFLGVFVSMAVWEFLAARRPRSATRARRWPGNLGIVVVDAVVLRLVFPLTAVAWAASVEGWGIGLFHILGWPPVVTIALAVVLLDLAIWAQHVVFHRIPVLWRLHRMHHADVDLDVTSGARFHPIEILLSMAIKFVVIVALGVPAIAVLIFEILLNAGAMFNHANVRLSARVDAVIRRVLVTPDMHRVHHSVDRVEMNSNFGFCLPWWDLAFGTYRAQPRAGQTGMTIGLPSFRDRGEARLDRLLTQPFRDAQEEAAP